MRRNEKQAQTRAAPSDPLSLGVRQLSRVLGGDGQPGCGESLIDVLVDGVECGAEFGWGLGLVGGKEG